ncbi:gliding motility-associated C-terminal domain-containing protein [Haliscomenobacter hydrossis]|uniref:Uncharacterized protein n=1 Tax=Haliscomenobacter hydrossis (strain ATCC 27775 / DSM 1100 / LMG 10767 / O) TaxID=760192 RepID=F4KPS3_HALH1|nr:gliding motility-associated C-terminal domain-containing protein [Haliscomenobacter hydrossis]AEE52173.1 hypothetical protein Halhy_4329 [Haliscomenobacter hydrossis DSM 1100]
MRKTRQIALFSRQSILRLILLIAAVWPVLGWGQTVIFNRPTGASYINTDNRTFDSYGPTTITGCSSVDFSVSFSFSLGWGGSGNMESSDECISGCAGDPNDPAAGGCFACWDFIWVRFFVNGNEVGGDLIGTGNNQQNGMIQATGIAVSPGDVVSIEVYTQTWEASERITFSNIRITGTNAPVDLVPRGPFCQNSGSVALGASQNGITGTWSGVGVSGNSLNTNVGGAGIRTLTFTPATGQCALPNSIDVEITPAAPVDLTPFDPFCQGTGNIALGNNQGGITGNWSGTGVASNALNTGTAGIRTLRFTPNPGQCATFNTTEVEIVARAPAVLEDLGPYCQNSGNISLNTLQNDIAGTWTGTGVAFNILNTNVGGTGVRTLTFTPGAGQCATPNTLQVTINPRTTITLTPISTPICRTGGNIALITNQSGIPGTWSGSGVSGGNILNPTVGPLGNRLLTFTPAAGQCANVATQTVSVVASTAITLGAIGPFCQTDARFPLVKTQSGISGTWSGIGVTQDTLDPSVGSTGTRMLSFTPNAGQCATTPPLNVTITPGNLVVLSPIGPLCGNTSSIPLNTTQNGVTGTWSGPGVTGGNTLNPAVGGLGIRTLTFSPTSGQCAAASTLDVVVNSSNAVNLVPIGPFCQGQSVVPLDTLQNGVLGTWSGPGVIGGKTLNTSLGGAGLRNLVFTPSGCSNKDSIQVTVNLQPQIDSIADVSICGDGYTLPAIGGTGLSGNEAYFSAANGTGTRFAIGTRLDTTQTLFAYDATAGCAAERTFRLNLQLAPDIDSIRDTVVCEDYVLPLIRGRNLSSNAAYFTQSLGGGTRFNPGQSINSTQTLFVFDGTPVCFDQDTFNITLRTRPRLDTIADVQVCTNYTLPNIAGTNLSGNQAYFTGPQGSGTKFTPGQAIAGDLILFAFDSVAGCSDERSFRLDTLSPPVLGPILDTVACGGLQLPAIKGSFLSPNVAYFDGPNGTGTRFSVGQTLNFSANLFAFDQKGICTAQQPFRISITPGPQIELAISNPITCNGSNDGALNLRINNSLPPLNFRWNPSSLNGTEDPSGLSAGIYTVSVTDGTGCEVSASATLIEPAALSLSCAPSKVVSKVDGDDGEANLTINGGTARYSLVLVGPVNQNLSNLPAGLNLLSGLRAGNYRVFVTDSLGCRDSCQFTITQPSCALTIAVNQTNPTCSGVANGQLEVIVTSGAAPYTIDWAIDALDGQFNPRNLRAGIYSFVIEDNIGCRVSNDTLTLVAPAPLTLACIQDSPVTRVGGNNGSARISTGGGTTPYTLTWMGPVSGTVNLSGSGNIGINDLKAGAYRIQLQDANNCIDSCALTITEPICSLDVAIVTVQSILCNGDDNGILAANIRNGRAPYTYVWSNGMGTATRDTLSNLGPGTYTLSLTDDLGCRDTTRMTLTTPPPVVVNCQVLSAVSTVGGRDGQAILRFSGGTGTITLDWGGAQPGNVIASGPDSLQLGGLAAGTYAVNFIDTNGCLDSCSFSIQEPVCNLQARLEIQDPACQGASNGEIVALITSGVAPFTFDWSGAGPNNDTLSNLVAGNYPVTITDALNCRLTLDTILRDPAVLNLSCQTIQNVRTVNGQEGIARLTFSGGTAPFFFNIRGPVSSTRTEGNPGSIDLANLTSGNYTIDLSDINGCQQTCSFTISEPACNLIVQTQTTAPLCNGAANGEIVVTINNGKAPFQYDWSDNTLDGQATARNLGAGTYSVVVSDSIGCIGFDTVVVAEPAALNLNCGTPIPTTTLGGQNGSISLRFSGGTGPYTLLLSGTKQDSFLNLSVDSFRVNGLAKGDYRLTLVDANNCSIPGCDFTISDPNCNLDLRLTGTNNDCAGASSGRIQTAVQGAVGNLSYDWSIDRFDGLSEANGLPSGSYTLIISDDRLCKDTAGINITEPARLNTDCQVISNPSTVGGSEGQARIIITGGSGFGGIRISGPSAGQTDDFRTDTINYRSLRAGRYQVIVRDVNNCVDTCGFVLDPVACTVQGAAQITNPTCNGSLTGSINVTASGNNGAVNYFWNNPLASGQNPTSLPAGNYTVTLTDAAQCSDTLRVTLTDPPALNLSLNLERQPTAANPTGGSLRVTFSGGTPNYSISTNRNNNFSSIGNAGFLNIDNVSAGNLTVILRDRLGCRDTAFIRIEEIPCNLSVDVAATRADCASSHLNSSVSNGTAPYQYTWSNPVFNGIANPRNATPGRYVVTVSDAQGCLAIDSIVVLDDPAALQIQLRVANPRCPGDLGLLTVQAISGGQGPFNLSLDNGTPQRFSNPPFSLRNLNPGNFSLNISNASGCSLDTSFTIVAPIALSLDLGPDTTLRKGASLTFSPQVNFDPMVIIWSPLTALSGTEGLNARAEPQVSTTYALVLRDSLGCEVRDNIRVIVSGLLEAYFPTAFSPNEDNVNDYFTAYANTEVERIEVLRIFDRWGGMVFEGKDIPLNDPSQGWDGTTRGQLAAGGLYVYYSVVRLRNGSTYRAAGEVNLVR